jgi:hypothetical protein
MPGWLRGLGRMASISTIATVPRSRFHLYMAAAVVLIAFGGFFPTYWGRIAAGSFTGQPVMHLHGLLFFSWTLVFFTQSALVAAGRTPDHRKFGMFGIALFGAMMLSVPLVAINEIWAAERLGSEAGALARQFVVVPLVGMVVLIGFFSAAIANIDRPQVHRRLMLTMQIPLLQAAMGRVFRTLLAPEAVAGAPAPGAFVSVPAGIAVDLLLVVAMVHDKRTIGRVHWVYWLGLPVVLAEQLLVVPISTSAAWLEFASWLQHLAR